VGDPLRLSHASSAASSAHGPFTLHAFLRAATESPGVDALLADSSVKITYAHRRHRCFGPRDALTQRATAADLAGSPST
jgi:hypothetical protein